VSTSAKAKAVEKPAEGSLESVFEILERKVEALSMRLAEVNAANAKLSASAAEAGRENERLAGELEKARQASGREGELPEKLSRQASEREAVRARIERLIKNLEPSEDPRDRSPD